jgi:signal transduction histidine kinase
VLIAAAADPALPGGVSIRVSDAGPGVPEAFVPRLFDRYSQGSSTATGGSGLGLSVVRDLVTAHHGTVSYDLPGNAFVFTLPPASRHDAHPLGGARGATGPADPAGEEHDAARRMRA